MRYKLPERMDAVMLDDVKSIWLTENTARQIEAMRRSHGRDVFLSNVWPVFSRTARKDIISAVSN